MQVFVCQGRLGKDPEIRTAQSGTTICQFSVAITRRFKNKQTNSYDTDWLNCVAFGNTGEFIGKYFQKGNMIGVIGTIQTRNWDDQEGKKHYVTEVIVEQAHFCGSKTDGNSRALPDFPGAAPQEAPAGDGFFPGPEDDTALPFDI